MKIPRLKGLICAISILLCFTNGTVSKLFAGGDDLPEFVCQLPNSLHWIALCPGNQNYRAGMDFVYRETTKGQPLELINPAECKSTQLYSFDPNEMNKPINPSTMMGPDLTYWTGHHKTVLRVRRYTIVKDDNHPPRGIAVTYYPWSAGGGVLFSNIPGKPWVRLDADISTATIPAATWNTLETSLPGKFPFNGEPKTEIQKFIGTQTPWKRTAYQLSGSSTIIIDVFRDRPYVQDRVQIIWNGFKGQKSQIYEGEFRGEYSVDGQYKILLLGGCPTAVVLDQHGTLMQEITACTGRELF